MAVFKRRSFLSVPNSVTSSLHIQPLYTTFVLLLHSAWLHGTQQPRTFGRQVTPFVLTVEPAVTLASDITLFDV